MVVDFKNVTKYRWELHLNKLYSDVSVRESTSELESETDDDDDDNLVEEDDKNDIMSEEKTDQVWFTFLVSIEI